MTIAISIINVSSINFEGYIPLTPHHTIFVIRGFAVFLQVPVLFGQVPVVFGQVAGLGHNSIA